MSPAVSNNLIFSSIILFVIVSIASNTLNYMSVQTNKEALDQNQEMVEAIKNITQNTNSVSKQNNDILKLFEDRLLVN